MNTEDLPVLPTYGVSAKPVTRESRTKNQIKAAALADASTKRSHWKKLVAEACIVWPQIAREDLDGVEGNFSKLAGLVQLRYQIGRIESDQQAQAFFDKHYPKS